MINLTLNTMEMISRTLIDNYNWLFHDLADPRTQDYFLVSSPFSAFAVVFIYFYLVTKWGPKMMRGREPFKINGLVQLYNLVQVVLCSYIVIRAIIFLYGPSGAYSLSCEPLDFSDTEFNRDVVKHVWLYFMLKLLDLFGTVLFVLKKKYSQITGVHMYHHMGMFTIAWIVTKYIPGGQSVIVGVLNCFMHTFMYSYYFLTNKYPQYQQSLWWNLKKHITQLQLVEAVSHLILYGQVLYYQNCKYPKWPVLLFLPNNIAIIYLFIRFYQRSYLTKEKSKTS